MSVEVVKSKHIIRNGILVHQALTTIMLGGKSALTVSSKGKHFKPT